MSSGAFKFRVPDDNTYYQGYKAGMFEIIPIMMGIAYGAYIVVYIASVYVLLSEPGFTSSPRRVSLLGITTFMFALGIIVQVLSIVFGGKELNADSSTACTTTSYLMCIICDSFCAWRTVIIWNKDKRVIAILVSFILASAGIAGCTILIQGLFFGKFYSVLFAAPILATNLLSTGLFAWKAWQRRIPVMDHLRGGSGSLRLERVFALLTESGFIYCCIWIFHIIWIGVRLHDPGFNLIVFVSGLYPTLIIILISKQMSPIEHYSTHSTYSTEMRDTGVPTLRPLGDHGSKP